MTHLSDEKLVAEPRALLRVEICGLEALNSREQTELIIKLHSILLDANITPLSKRNRSGLIRNLLNGTKGALLIAPKRSPAKTIEWVRAIVAQTASQPNDRFALKFAIVLDEVTIRWINGRDCVVLGAARDRARKLCLYADRGWILVSKSFYDVYQKKIKAETSDDVVFSEPDMSVPGLMGEFPDGVHHLFETREEAQEHQPSSPSVPVEARPRLNRAATELRAYLDDSESPLRPLAVTAVNQVFNEIESLRVLKKEEQFWERLNEELDARLENVIKEHTWANMELISLAPPNTWKVMEGALEQRRRWTTHQDKIRSIAELSRAGEARRLHVFPEKHYPTTKRALEANGQALERWKNLLHLMIAECICHIRPRVRLANSTHDLSGGFEPLDSATLYQPGGKYFFIYTDIKFDNYDYVSDNGGSARPFAGFLGSDNKVRQYIYDALQSNFYHGWKAEEREGGSFACFAAPVLSPIDVYRTIRSVQPGSIIDETAIKDFLPREVLSMINRCFVQPGTMAEVILAAFEHLIKQTEGRRNDRLLTARQAERSLFHCLESLTIFCRDDNDR